MAPEIRCPPRADVLRLLPGETVLDAALRQRVPLASSCGGRAVCGDCVVRIADGDASFPPPDADEAAWRARKRYDGALRLACCLRPTGDGAVSTTYW